MKLFAPDFTNYEGMLGLKDALARNQKNEVELDFSRLGFAYPDGMLLLARIICDHIEAGSQIIPTNFENQTYPINMGFFQAAGLDIPPKGAAPGNANYYPVTKISTKSVRDKASAYRQDPGEVVNSMAADLASILIRQGKKEERETVTYAIREIVRNIIEHSGSEDFTVSAQYYPHKGLVEVAIMDRGTGIRNGLSNNPHLSLLNDYEAILKALVPGISGSFYRGMPEQKKTEWSNSGFGLFMTSQICRMGGRFTIGSCNSLVTMTKSDKQHISFGFSGTFIVMQMNVSTLPKLIGLLRILAHRGERVARLVQVKADVEASYASKFIMESR